MANHSHRHAWWTNFLIGRTLLRQIEEAQQAVRAATGRSPAYYRPPVGLTNPSLARALRRAGLKCVGWDARGLDRGGGSAEGVARRVLRRATGGSIIVLHDGGAHKSRLLDIVSLILEGLDESGYSPVSLDELLGATNELTPRPAS